jgi:hypothetical protein
MAAAADIHAAEVEEDIVSLPESEKVKDPHRFAFICRQHGGKEHLGEVEDIDKASITGTILYRVRYEDDDLEHFTLNELLALIVPAYPLTVSITLSEMADVSQVILTNLAGDTIFTFDWGRVVGETLGHLRTLVRRNLVGKKLKRTHRLILPTGFDLITLSPHVWLKDMIVAAAHYSILKTAVAVATTVDVEKVESVHAFEAGLAQASKSVPEISAALDAHGWNGKQFSRPLQDQMLGRVSSILADLLHSCRLYGVAGYKEEDGSDGIFSDDMEQDESEIDSLGMEDGESEMDEMD